MIAAYQDDCSILRDHPDCPDLAMVMDCNGSQIFVLPKDWTDDQIWLVLQKYNDAHALGVSKGMQIKAEEVRRALFL